LLPARLLTNIKRAAADARYDDMLIIDAGEGQHNRFIFDVKARAIAGDGVAAIVKGLDNF